MGKNREQEYREIFVAETQEDYDFLCTHIVTLEREPKNEAVIDEIFRILHNLKANSKAIGYVELSRLAHNLESIFGQIRDGQLEFSGNLIKLSFKGVDIIGDFLEKIKTNEFSRFPEGSLEHYFTLLEKAQAGELDRIDVNEIDQTAPAEQLSFSELIHIPIRKLDYLLNLVGELMIDREQVLNISKTLESTELKNISSHLYRISNEIQQSVMDARLITIGYLFNKFPRVVRDVAQAEGKKVQLKISGEEIKIDRNILQLITDSLMHLVRNAINHGLEKPGTRKKAGKPEMGTIWLKASGERDMVLIEIIDDGRGIDVEKIKKKAVEEEFLTQEEVEEMKDREIIEILFEAGFSLSNEVTEYKGRGVGLDVVKTDVNDVGGRVSIESESGKGTTFKLFLPTSIAVKAALLFVVNKGHYAIPLLHIDQVVKVQKDELHRLGNSYMIDINGVTIPVFELKPVLSVDWVREETADNLTLPALAEVVIISHNNRKVGLIVDKLEKQQDIVVKQLNKPVNNINLYSGVTLLGSGEVCLVLDIPVLLKELTAK